MPQEVRTDALSTILGSLGTHLGWDLGVAMPTVSTGSTAKQLLGDYGSIKPGEKSHGPGVENSIFLSTAIWTFITASTGHAKLSTKKLACYRFIEFSVPPSALAGWDQMSL